METRADKERQRARRRRRYRHKLAGSPEIPRLLVFRSLKHIYAQAVDDRSGKTIASASTLDGEVRKKISNGGNIAAAKIVGETLAERLAEKGIQAATFDRGGYLYHGRVRAVAEAAREKGLKI
ncbi:MAG TPA: 50S ribosomal protein L18 [Candidatus Saccharimonadales bacterium]|nr:50S ribosomal protein L18 [Candidatus Saccharimonadales bacterium]